MANKEYKSDVFSMLLQDKNRALEVYNAINGTDYDDPEMVEMTTLDDKSFSLTVRNDASFILDANLSLYEHQSTYCPNMPLRDLLYFASIIQKRIKAQKRDIYGGKILKILREYMYFVDMVRKNNEISGNLEDAIRQAIDHCIEEDVLRDFLDENREEVMHVMTLDYTFERRLEMQRAEAIEDGQKIGKEIGKEEKLSELIQKKILKNKPLDQIADELEESPETIRPLYEKIRQEMQQ